MSSNVKAACLLFALLGASQNAYAIYCYQIIDRDNSPIYSSTYRHSLWQDRNGITVSNVCEQLGGTCFGSMHLHARSNLREV